ncbi:MAG TPA: tRNA lysidine(34) synthetase TilS [Thermoleophilaceae bacterium]|nr:tRNA lysidine(34) synthetase TilS [Thermoleophilaceae bacterium]
MNPLEAARASGLVVPGEPLLVLLSGGGDSVCLLDVAVELEAGVAALHVNHGLRADADDDERFCRDLCERLGVALTVERAGAPPAGNVQAWARDLRYTAAERVAAGDYATGHTVSDLAETVVYRLAASPGRRALLGMAPRRGRLVRPLLEVTRADTHAWCRERGLEWRDDATNMDTDFTRARVRHAVMPELGKLNPGAERNIAETARRLREEAAVLEAAVDAALERLGPAPALAALRGDPLARAVLERLAGTTLNRERVEAILRADDRGTHQFDIPGGARALVEYGRVRFARGAEAAPADPVALPVPGSARFGDWEVEALPGEGGEAVLSADQLAPPVTVRAWRDGDRMHPAGMVGTKSLQDLFTDRKVPRALRRTLPVVEANGEVVWVAGVAAAERAPGEPVSLSARSASRGGGA